MGTRKYKHPVGCDVPSCTTITGQLDKSGALTYWAAGAACDYVWDNLCESLEYGNIDSKVLLPVLEKARKNFRSVSKSAMDTGSRIHGHVEQYFKTGKEPLKPSNEELSAFLAFLEWKDAHKVEPIQLEHTVYGYDWAGTLDFYGVFNGKKYVIDWKSSKGIYDEMRYQVAGYRSAVGDCEGCGILRLDKTTGLPEWVDTSDTYEDDLSVFNILTNLWWARHPKDLAKFKTAVGGGTR